MQAKLWVAVLMGGPSEEHAISLKSGHGVADALLRRGWPVEPISIPQTQNLAEVIIFTRKALSACGADVVFIALHGQFGEDGTIQALCESLRLPYVGSGPEASRLGMDKIASRRYFESAGLVVPRWKAVEAGEADVELAVSGWAHPLVVKPSDQGSSIGVSLAKTAAELPAACKEAGRFSRQVLIEEFVAGREMTVGILGDRALPVIEIKPHETFFDFTAKYTTGATDYLVPAPIAEATAERLQAAGLRAHQALGCRHMSRADFILRPDGASVILEVNTIPGFTPTSLLPKSAAVAGIAYDALCEQLVQMALTPATTRLFA